MSISVDRLQRASTRFFFHYEEMEVQVHNFSKAEWARFDGPDPTNNRRFGWVPPRGEGEAIVLAMCPELIVDQTADLEERLFDAYLDVIQFTSDMHIALQHIDDDYERSCVVDGRLFDTAKGSMRLLNEVQLNVLDRVLDGTNGASGV